MTRSRKFSAQRHGAILSALPYTPSSVLSQLPTVLKGMLDQFGNKPFMLHQSQVFPTFSVHNVYESDESSFEGTVRTVALYNVPLDANGSNSHTIYKVKEG